ncbi:MAG: hypothetical protein RIG61_11885 [Deltaproteobacteria bacterium]
MEAERDLVKRNTVNWKAAVIAGVIAGIVFLILEMLLVQFVGGGSAWGPPRMMAAIVMGQEVLPPPATFDAGVVVTALIVHLILSIIYGVILSVIINKLGIGMALLIGAVSGLILYIVNFYGFTAVFPWFAKARNFITIFSHIIFGLVAAWAYKKYQRA